MQFQDSIKTCLNKYATFDGRASRSEYWWFILFHFIVSAVAAALSDNIYYAVVIGLFLPSIAVGVRRLHDRDKSGWWMLLVFLPLIGSIILIVWYCQRGTESDNRFGSPEAPQLAQ